MNRYGSESTTKYTIEEKRSYLISKRIMDIIGASLGLIILIPLFLFIAICIKIEDPKGKVFFRQTRVGKESKEFQMYKFRSMVTNAEDLLDSLIHRNETTGAMFKIKDDPRVTKIGRFIRKTSIDELPQLWNVIKGDMSLVGPRPPLPEEVKKYTDYERQRLLVKSGCTGLWQVSGRSNVGFEEMVELDLKYIKNRSFNYDMKLIIKTIFVVFKGTGSY